MKNTKFTLGILILLTIASAIMAQSTSTHKEKIILLVASIKFIGIAFTFMEISKAHSIWKIAIIIYLLIVVGAVLIIT